MRKDLILSLTEDLIEDDQLNQISKAQKTKKRISSNQDIPTKGPSNNKDLMTEVAKILEIPMDELQEWVKDSSLPDELLKAIFRIAKCFKLNPLFGHIGWELNAESDYEVYIPIDGWITLIHRQPTFQGIAFSQSSDNDNGIPIWAECVIYRSDLTHPVTVREYFAELKTDHPMWQAMPRRMLRHKTLQQCARLAFGITMPEIYQAKNQTNRSKSNLLNQEKNFCRSKELLKEKLQINKLK
jgi:hypothetical protein